MDLKDKINACAYQGGNWNHLKTELIASGLSEKCTDNFIACIKENLGKENAEKAVAAYEGWKKNDDENEICVYIVKHRL